MADVAVVTDSCASIPPALVAALGIAWVPYYVHRGQEVLRDLVSVQGPEFYAWLETAETLPTTAAPGPGDYFELYRQLAAAGTRDIVSLHMTSKGSAAYQAATLGAEMLSAVLPEARVVVIDTLNVSMCTGWLAIEAARAARAERPLADVVAHVRRLLPQARMLQTADTLKYLYMGGRIGRATHLVGSLLSIKPIISMEDGVIVPLGRARTRQKAYRLMVDLL
ncbi:MAG: DegV family protein, partial [Anaerolineales bacterium]|nr:DegV family protein [Anaerolineales bacterium]